MPVLTVGAPSATTTAWCVAVEPIESGKVGRVAVGGVVQLKVADLGKTSGAHVLWKDSTWALIRIQAGVIRGTFSGTWTKGSTTTVTDAVVSGATYTAKNYIATLSGSACLIAYVADEWVLVGWDWHSMTGYSASAQQVLTHAANGGLEWVSTTACT
jgi:predicted RecA/RadA family phage recombinase